MGWLGHVDDDVRNAISYLKTCKMINEIGGAPITKDIVLETIRKLNEESEEHLGTFIEVGTFVSKDCAPSHVHRYCEHENLSLRFCGMPFKALKVKK